MGGPSPKWIAAKNSNLKVNINNPVFAVGVRTYYVAMLQLLWTVHFSSQLILVRDYWLNITDLKSKMLHMRYICRRCFFRLVTRCDATLTLSKNSLIFAVINILVHFRPLFGRVLLRVKNHAHNHWLTKLQFLWILNFWHKKSWYFRIILRDIHERKFFIIWHCRSQLKNISREYLVHLRWIKTRLQSLWTR